jgi:hypothetical protein
MFRDILFGWWPRPATLPTLQKDWNISFAAEMWMSMGICISGVK